MTTTQSPPPSASRPPRSVHWWSQLGVLIELELRQRVRTTKWKLTLGLAFVAITIVVFGSMYLSLELANSTYRDWSQNLYAIVMAAELFFAVILAPTLSATAINGDRKDATLAVVQATPVNNWQLAFGKLAANWISCLALLAIGSPFLVWGIVASPYGIGVGILGVLVLCVLFACYGAIGLGFSALTSRPAGSAVLTQATVFFLILGLPALFAMAYPATAQEHTVVRATYGYPSDSVEPGTSPDDQGCQEVEQRLNFYHTERIWWLLAPNPFLILPDLLGPHDNQEFGSYSNPAQGPPTVIAPVADVLSSTRTGPYIAARRCEDLAPGYLDEQSLGNQPFYFADIEHGNSQLGQSWYLGLLFNILLGSLGVLIAASRLRVPVDKLPKGVRIA